SQPQLRTSEEEIKQVLRITLGDDEIALRLEENSTRGFDSETDAMKMLSESSRLYSSIDSNDYSINATSIADQCIELRTSGSGTLTFSGISSFPEKWVITLTDRKTGKSYIVTD